MEELLEQEKVVFEFLKRALLLFDEANIVLPEEATIHIYHHCGTESIKKIGAVFINVVNRDYCKSYIVMLQGQNYPNHYHKIKTESFYVLFGTLGVTIDDKNYLLEPGEMLHIERGQDHSFWTTTGVVFEEISTRYVPNDSFYLEKRIRETTYAERRTSIKADEWKEIRRKWKK